MNILCDFDGTLTKEIGTLYEEKGIQFLAKRIHINLIELTHQMELARIEIYKHPDRYGWEIDTRIVAPATTDRFLLMNVMSQLAISKLRKNKIYASRLKAIDISQINNELFTLCYPFAESIFREGAKDFLETERKNITIITNSLTEHVTAQLQKLRVHNVSKLVRGNAKKYLVSSNTPVFKIPNLSRPVFLNRPYYKKILDEYSDRKTNTIVLGDVAELDLFLPLFLGFRVILFVTDKTPQWEIDYITHHPKGACAHSLLEASQYIDSLSDD
jgi:hypothetical protein